MTCGERVRSDPGSRSRPVLVVLSGSSTFECYYGCVVRTTSVEVPSFTKDVRSELRGEERTRWCRVPKGGRTVKYGSGET